MGSVSIKARSSSTFDGLAAGEVLQPLVAIRYSGRAQHRLHGFAEHFPGIGNIGGQGRGARLDLRSARVRASASR